MIEYINELKKYLTSLNKDDFDSAITYYSEFLEDGGFINYEDCVRELGTPQHLSKNILQEFGIRSHADVVPEKKHIDWWVILLLILASPFLLSFLIIIASIIFSIVVTIASVLISLFLGGIVGFIAAVIYIFDNLQISLMQIGLSIFALGLVIIMFPSCMKLFKIIYKLTINGFISIVNSVFHVNYNKK
ncbi:DUF1700 domain-containing protein [Apilactobacillus apisilvae]|uniref:DUF1700 domain-containing protein n=1 Tax=Apilactobacillus apisilvae TaxID=2923364 RepID=A0ABY4PGK5_9LACO|nr:DUF1700 domain-containing protein [Apilactobacillus apisilvae]UQS84869.1 DUF1700 domain-containing protein [Apilactobacillus apisilvae]